MSNWSKKEFFAYVLIYAAHCNFFQSEEEERYILSKVDTATFYKIHMEVVVHSDEENLTKIQHYLSENKFNQQEKDNLLKELKAVFFADGSVDILEKQVFHFFKKILN